jgi:hypothetical protein
MGRTVMPVIPRVTLGRQAAIDEKRLMSEMSEEACND